jgi:hypothetical protein
MHSSAFILEYDFQVLTAYCLVNKDEHSGSFSLPRVAMHYLKKYTSQFPFLFLLPSVRNQLFSSLSKLFQCGNIQYALVPENGNQFLYEFKLTREVLELPYSTSLLLKKKRRLLKILFDLAIASMWLLGENKQKSIYSYKSINVNDIQFQELLMSYIKFITLNKKIMSKKGMKLIF